MSIIQAAQFAARSHLGQQRKYNGQPYIFHPARVAGRVAIHPLATEEMVAAAFLHDVLEDCDVTYGELEGRFGRRLADMVQSLTNPSKGSSLSRARRKQMDRDHLATVNWQIKIIKLIDRIDNVQELQGADSSFMLKYALESELLADVIGDADLELKAELLGYINNLKAEASK